MNTTVLDAYYLGRERGEQDRKGNPLSPEPYPPFSIGTPEANAWITGYRDGRYGRPINGCGQMTKDYGRE